MRLTNSPLVVKGIMNRWVVPIIYNSSQASSELARCGQVTLWGN